MLSRLTLLQKGSVLLSVVLFMQLAFLGILAYFDQRDEHKIEAELRTQLAVGHMDKVANLWSLLSLEFPRALAVDDADEYHIARFAAEIEEELNTTKALLLANPKERAQITASIADVDSALDLVAHAAEARARKDILGFRGYIEQIAELSSTTSSQSKQLLAKLIDQENSNRLAQERLSRALNNAVWIGASITVSTTLALTYLFIATISNRAERISRNLPNLVKGVTQYAPEEGDDEITRLDRTFRDMASGLVEAANKERAVIRNALDMISTLDAEAKFLRVNPAARSLLGYEYEEFLGHPFLDFVVPDDRKSTGAMLQTVRAGKKPAKVECRMAHKDESIVDILFSANWSDSESSYFCVAHSITQRRQMERMRRQFVAMITHDLRNPLNSVLNILESFTIGVYEISSEKGLDRIKQALQNIERMLRLISDLTEMGQLDLTSLSIEFKQTSIAQIIQDSIGSIIGYADQQHISIETHITDSLIEADRQRMGQVLTNLLANAIKFSPPQSSISVSSRSHDTGVRIEIMDSGPGISEADQKIIFEPYKQAERIPEQKALEGTGLGLTICKSIVEAHRGTIGVASALSKGTTFWIEIPYRQSMTRQGMDPDNAKGAL